MTLFFRRCEEVFSKCMSLKIASGQGSDLAKPLMDQEMSSTSKYTGVHWIVLISTDMPEMIYTNIFLYLFSAHPLQNASSYIATKPRRLETVSFSW